ncbi:acyl-CoA dehydrogenase family protein [Paracoccus sp. P2]|uniref:Acyl-CoA dehydrogenase family protein n=1 Tax=Paracoccus pantotrophus TaxID=82367 RepID=A0A7H9BNK8_PARPN|nr:acyl-CoA dehydrogenase family protein [Paracoccus pantotrophus]MDF3853619.1 acyl-CoA dehydrogenase family protein [Paracoccus pantotrophus]QLH12782.1 acyl-CoA dehydrogenase family protein [Paracoccus pantotrophus]RDD97315.1 acyl-CoA dehydrogenase [Paracoccus pantotrophus]RNI14824.1 acyl-CoA dehydrogenase [Paracoccus pantotrophus]WGR66393.1 acyl-CoA dehydrogenase [Paracoccus pantotrophus]
MAMDPDTLAQLCATLRRFVDEQLIPAEAEVAETDAIPERIVAGMRELGLFGLTAPEEYGGLGLTMEEEVMAIFELGRAAPAFRSMFATNVGIGMQGIAIDGTPEQKAKYLPRLASGELIGSFALTEPDVGSDAGSIKATARRDGDFYVLNGTKRFITNAPHAGLFTVMARTDPGQKGAAGVSAFAVERDAPGLSLGKPEKKMGQQGAHVCDVILDDCRVPVSALIGGVEGQGFKTAMKVLDKGRLHIAAACVGLAERIIDDMLDYAVARRQFGRPLADFQLLQAMFADSRADAYAARCMVLDAARKRDDGRDVGVEASCAKMFASEAVGRIADRNVQVHGGNGYIREYRAEQLYRDARLFRIYEGTTQIQQIIIAKAMAAEARARAGL